MLGVSTSFTVAHAAEGEEAPTIDLVGQGSEEPENTIDLSGPPKKPLERRTFHLHEGFYLRMNLGVGVLRANIDDDGTSAFDLDLAGFSTGFDVLIGGSPARGLAIGGGFFTNTAISARVERGSRDVGDRNMTVGFLGPFIDGFPNPKKGWHLGGTIGLAAVKVEEDSPGDDVASAKGLGGAAWFGHGWWVADEWSMGLMLRFAASATTADDSVRDLTIGTFSSTLMFSALYH